MSPLHRRLHAHVRARAYARARPSVRREAEEADLRPLHSVSHSFRAVTCGRTPLLATCTATPEAEAAALLDLVQPQPPDRAGWHRLASALSARSALRGPHALASDSGSADW